MTTGNQHTAWATQIIVLYAVTQHKSLHVRDTSQNAYTHITSLLLQ